MSIAPWVIGISVWVIYLLMVLYLGHRAGKAGMQTFLDESVASRTMGVVVLTFTFAASYHSAYAFMGIVGFASADGIPFWMNGLWLIPPAFLFWQFGKRLWILGRIYDYVTLPEFLRQHFNSKLVGGAAAFIQSGFTVPYVAIQLAGSGYIFETISQGRIPFEVGAAVMMVVMVIYVWMGGVRAVAWTDTMQGIIMFIAVFFGSLWVVRTVGGSVTGVFAEALAEIPEAFSLPGTSGGVTSARWVSQWMTMCFGMIMSPQIALRYFTADSLKTLKWASIWGGLYLLVIYAFTPAVGLLATLSPEVPAIYAADQFFPAMLWTTLPTVIAAIMLGGGFAASMSTADSQLHAVSVSLSSDIYRGLIKPDADDSALRKIIHLSHIVVAAIALWVIISEPPMMIDLVGIALAGMASLLPAVVGALYWRKSTGVGAAASILLGIAAVILTQWIWQNPFGLNIMPGLWGMIVGALAMVTVSSCTSPTDGSKAEEHHKQIEKVLG